MHSAIVDRTRVTGEINDQFERILDNLSAIALQRFDLERLETRTPETP